MYEIVEYEEKYKNQLIKLWLDVSVEEFGYEQWRKDMSKVENFYEKIVLAIVDEKVVGSVAYINKTNNIAEIKRVYVYSEFRGSGLSQKLFDLILKDIEEKGYEKILVETWGRFSRGINFYKKNKFLLKEKVGECYRYEREISNV